MYSNLSRGEGVHYTLFPPFLLLMKPKIYTQAYYVAITTMDNFMKKIIWFGFSFYYYYY